MECLTDYKDLLESGNDPPSDENGILMIMPIMSLRFFQNSGTFFLLCKLVGPYTHSDEEQAVTEKYCEKLGVTTLRT